MINKKGTKALTRIYNNSNYQAEFEESHMPIAESPLGFVSNTLSRHNAPCKQFVTLLSGKIEVQIGW